MGTEAQRVYLIAIKDNDLIVASYGRGIWVLDDFSMLRQLTPELAAEPVHLFAPGEAIRVRRNVSWATPLPPEIPHALNPPDGAILSYYLAAKPAGEVITEIQDAAGRPVRRLSSVAEPPVAEAARPPYPNYWLATPSGLPTEPGTNRANWDLRYDAPKAFSHSFEIHANLGLTPPSPEGPLAPPGVYTVRLTVEGKHYVQRLTVRNDPRSRATPAALAAQHRLLIGLRAGIAAMWEAINERSRSEGLFREWRGLWHRRRYGLRRPRCWRQSTASPALNRGRGAGPPESGPSRPSEASVEHWSVS